MRASSAASRELLPCLFERPASAPEARSSFATSTCPIRQAHSKAESPLSSWSLHWAPRWTSRLQIAVWPCSAARMSGVAPNSPRMFGGAPESSRRRTSSRFPRVQAAMRASATTPSALSAPLPDETSDVGGSGGVASIFVCKEPGCLTPMKLLTLQLPILN